MTATAERPPTQSERQEPQGLVPLLMLLGGLLFLGVVFGPAVPLLVAAFAAIIFCHELGHYVAAKRSGMKVTEFFLGFGPRIWSFRRGETEYGLKALPAGAYVKIIGMHNLDEVDPADEARTYRRQSYPRRLVTVAAGPLTNLGIALVLMGILLVSVGVPKESAWSVERVVPESAAAAAGVQPDDRIVAVNGVRVDVFEDLSTLIRESGGTTVTLVVERGGQELTLDAEVGERLTPEGAAGFDLPGTSSLLAGNRILAIDGVETTYRDLVGRVAKGETHTLLVDDGVEIGEVDVVIGDLVEADDGVVGFLGVGPRTPLERVSVLAAPGEALRSTGTFIKASVTTMGRFFTFGSIGSFVGDSVHDQDTTTAVAGQQVIDASDENRILSVVGALNIGNSLVAEAGWAGFLFFLVTINIFLGVLNLVPLLPFDGGHIAVATYERIRSIGGREHRVDIRKLLPVTYAVVSIFVFLALIAVFRDIADPVPM